MSDRERSGAVSDRELTGAAPAPFDIGDPLPSGTTLLEASAGTGKTWTIGALVAAQHILETKAPDELAAYRAFVLEVAQSVGAAAEGGETAEAGTLEKIRTAVGG